ncbi:MAG: glycoside hydrolase family 130 protein [Kineosporiaceae bacterium]
MTPTAVADGLVTRTDVELVPDPSRVTGLLFLPGQEMAIVGASRAAGVVGRCLAMDDDDARDTLERVTRAHAGRHRDVDALFEANFEAVAHRVEDAASLARDRRLLIGACFTQEFALEAAALFNPSLVAHPDQDDPHGGLRLVMSLRAVGEGHLSSIVFTSATLRGTSARTTRLRLDPRSPWSTLGRVSGGPLHRVPLRHEALTAGADEETVRFVLDDLPDVFSRDTLDVALGRLDEQRLTRVEADATIDTLRRVAAESYEVSFAEQTELSERTLRPATARESRGVEDARFVRFTAADGSRTYLGTYTSYDGSRVSVSRIRTDDFRTFTVSPMTGFAAADKGLALFPRTVGGRHLALSRWDRENNALASSADGNHWDDAVPLQEPTRPWELIHLGNCGSPIETEQGWLVLTHAVGPVRTYAIGALLLDLDEPARVLGRLREPLLTSADDERDGYVPNVVYSCGSLRHGDTLVLPYGCSDARVRVAAVDLPALLDRLLTDGP